MYLGFILKHVFYRWLKDAFTDILKRLLETDPRRAMSFETFFNAADDVLSRRIVYVFSTTSARHFRFYLQPNSVYVYVYFWPSYILCVHNMTSRVKKIENLFTTSYKGLHGFWNNLYGNGDFYQSFSCRFAPLHNIAVPTFFICVLLKSSAENCSIFSPEWRYRQKLIIRNC